MKKKEQFSLALWDRLKKDNIPHEFETRSGVIINQINIINKENDQTIIGYDTFDNTIEIWDSYGFYTQKDKLSGVDLFIVWEEEQLMLEGWLNVYNNGSFAVYTTRKEADDYAVTRIACVKVSIPYTKGEGLNNG